MPKPTRAAVATPSSVLTGGRDAAGQAARDRLLDGLLAASFLSLTFLLGIFPLQDTDFWWHLRTGDLIRETGQVPQVDPYLFGGPAEKPWIDLHWLFQILLSVGYQLGGVDLLTLVKCLVTTAGVGLLLACRSQGSPMWVRVLAWTPPLLLLAGRMYVRPETLTFLYMAIFLVVIFHWRRRPGLTMLLPLVQILWVNTQGLFILGPMLLVFGLIDAALLREAPGPDRRWWSLVLGSCLMAGLACLINPYGVRGALFPLTLLGTMDNSLFDNIGELMPLGEFIRQAGWWNVSLGIHLGCLLLGVASFLLPLAWRGIRWVARRREGRRATSVRSSGRKRASRAAIDVEPAWRLRPFRVLVFATFAWLSWKATRNSHQFAAVTGAVAAWNLGEWAAALRLGVQDRAMPREETHSAPALALVVMGLLIAFVATGGYYACVGEGRRVGLGEAPLWFPHAAARVSTQPGMPERSICYHNGHSAVWIYHNGPERQTFADARLEVIGAELYRAYRELEQRIVADRGWEAALAEIGNPSLLLDHTQVGSAALPGRLLASSNWGCVHFDAIASVFVQKGFPAAREVVDFAQRHFEPDPTTDPADGPALVSLARTCHDLATQLRERPTLAERLILLGHGYARRATFEPGVDEEGWKRIGMLEYLRLGRVGVDPRGRVRAAFDPLVDAPLIGATFALERAREMLPDDFAVLTALLELYQGQEMYEEALPIAERLASLRPRNPSQRAIAEVARGLFPLLRGRIGAEPSLEWSNQAELNALVERLMAAGRVRTAAEVLESALALEARSWQATDRLAMLWLRLGEPSAARSAWEQASQRPRPAVERSRLGWSYLIEADYDAARRRFEEALRYESGLFEARFGLARLELDAGRRDAALERIDAALAAAPDSAARRLLSEWRAVAEPRLSP